MTRRAAVFVVGLVAAALVGVALLAVPGSPLERRPTLGLDLQGGLEVTLQAVTPRDRKLTKEDLDRSVSIMRSRVDKLGVSEPEIRTQGSDQISIQLPGVKDPAAAAAIIGKTAQLELFDLERDLVSPSIDARTRQPIATAKLYDLLAGQQALAGKGTPDTYYVFETKGKKLVRGPVQTKQAALSKWDGKLPPGHKLFAVPPSTVVVRCGAGGAVVCPGVAQTNPTQNSWYLMRYTPPEVPAMNGTQLKLKGTRQDFDTTSGEPIVLLEFNGKGNSNFHRIAKEEGRSAAAGARDARSTSRSCSTTRSGRGRRSTKQYPGGIDPAAAARRSRACSRSARRRARARAPDRRAAGRVRTVERTDVSATLGQDSLRQARNAAIVGLLLVVIFLLVIYRFLGVVAVIGLAVYAACMYGAILLFGVTLTLPGFAGLILTIGVAADANIVIFERIKEEARAGQIRAGGDRRRLREGLPHDPRRERGHVHHRAGAVRGRDGEREGLRADAADRHRDLVLTAVVARRARCSGCSPASGGSTTRASWARPRRRSRSGSGSTSSAGAGCGSSSRSSRSASASSRWSSRA